MGGGYLNSPSSPTNPNPAATQDPWGGMISSETLGHSCCCPSEPWPGSLSPLLWAGKGSEAEPCTTEKSASPRPRQGPEKSRGLPRLARQVCALWQVWSRRGCYMGPHPRGGSGGDIHTPGSGWLPGPSGKAERAHVPDTGDEEKSLGSTPTPQSLGSNSMSPKVRIENSVMN